MQGENCRTMATLPTGGSDRSASPIAFQPGGTHESSALLVIAKNILAARLKAFRALPRHLFRDEAWDMLLELYVAHHEGKKTLVKHLLLSANSVAAGMRRVDAMEEAGLLVRSRDKQDHRCTDVYLTERGLTSLTILLQDIRQDRI